MKLFLDDYREPIDCASYMYRRGVDCKIYHEKWEIVRSAGEFTRHILLNGLPDIISFDHDLTDVEELKERLPISDWYDIEQQRELTGLDCAKFLVDYCIDNKKPLPVCVVHSVNPDGAKNIESVLNTYIKIHG